MPSILGRERSRSWQCWQAALVLGGGKYVLLASIVRLYGGNVGFCHGILKEGAEISRSRCHLRSSNDTLDKYA
jgi:hypothetical protein